MPANLAESARVAFDASFGSSSAAAFVARAPARVELLGNHTDYNGGLVLAAAIDRATAVAGRRVEGPVARVRSANLDRLDTFDVEAVDLGPSGDWSRYVRGVALALAERPGSGGLVSGFEAAIVGDVPLGAGLSSSASLQAALALFLLGSGVAPGGADLDDDARMELAKRLRHAENAYVGVNSGLLDHFSTLFGRAGHALMLDCRTLEYDRLPLGDPAPAIVVCDSKTSRRLADGMYNLRRLECERVVDHFRAVRGPEAVQLLRDVSQDDLDAAWDALDPVGRLRARHVLNENERVRIGADLLRSGDVAGFGALMSASHASSRDDFANSSPALDALVEAAEASPGFLGGKLSGAGWAGCTVNLVRPDSADAFAESVAAIYARTAGHPPLVHICRADDGASVRTVG